MNYFTSVHYNRKISIKWSKPAKKTNKKGYITIYEWLVDKCMCLWLWRTYILHKNEFVIIFDRSFSTAKSLPNLSTDALPLRCLAFKFSFGGKFFVSRYLVDDGNMIYDRRFLDYNYNYNCITVILIVPIPIVIFIISYEYISSLHKNLGT